jgi:5-methylcytosine-specific restriction endonuclease McrA
MAMLTSRVLILNRSWVAVNVATVRRAIGLVYRGMARVVDTESYKTYDFMDWAQNGNGNGHPAIRGVSVNFREPEVILLTAFNGRHIREIKFSRRNIFERDQHTCQYCGRRFERANLTLDHVVPRSRGGRTTWDNVAVCCVRCNTRKGDRTPAEAGMHPVRTPCKPHWASFVGMRLTRLDSTAWRKFLNGNRGGVRPVRAAHAAPGEGQTPRDMSAVGAGNVGSKGSSE